METQMLMLIYIAIAGVIIYGVIIYFLQKWFLQGYKGTQRSKNNMRFRKEEVLTSNQKRYWLGEISEINTTYQQVGTEERIIDNLKSNGLVKRRLTITREWKKIISIDREANSYYKGKIGLPYGLIEGDISKSLTEKYGSSLEETKSFSEEIELEIAAHSKIILTITWKLIWQNGEIEVFSDSNEKIVIPYKIVKGITFDQMQEKIN